MGHFVSRTFQVRLTDWDGAAVEITSNGDGTAFLLFARGLGHDGSNHEALTFDEIAALADGLKEVAAALSTEG